MLKITQKTRGPTIYMKRPDTSAIATDSNFSETLLACFHTFPPVQVPRLTWLLNTYERDNQLDPKFSYASQWNETSGCFSLSVKNVEVKNGDMISIEVSANNKVSRITWVLISKLNKTDNNSGSK